jgi:ATP-dependent helicase HrpA
MNIPSCNPLLPIYERKGDIIIALRQSQVVIVSGETGSGKTSQLPLICCEAGLCRSGKIGITQPRRIAATSIASYVAQQCKTPLGSLVGYKVRFSDTDTRDTKIKFMTDGILLRELEHDRLLRAYDVVIVDEAHERSLNIDFLLGYMRTILPKRPHLRLIISSATINTQLFSKAFGNAPVISVSGRMYPVDIRYEPDGGQGAGDADADAAEADYVSNAVASAQRIIDAQPEGDVLVFMPTERDIVEAADMLNRQLEGRRCAIMPLFGRMPLADQQQIFKSLDRQKIVLATNIAETSLTVPNIRYVVDTGLARVKRYDPSMRITRLPVEPISQASAMQRAGRSGRVQDGVCVRLYAQEDFLSRPAYTLPEIQRANLGQVILSMAALRLGRIEDFPFLEPPPPRAVSQGYASLAELGALDKEKNLTDLGNDMAALPCDPPLSRMIIEARREQCVAEMLIIASGLCVTDMRVRPAEKKQEADSAHAKFTDPMSDFLFYLRLWDAYGAAAMDRKSSHTRLRKFCKAHFLSLSRMREWQDVHNQLLSIVNTGRGPKARAKTVAYDRLHRCILAGFLSCIAKKTEDNDYQVAKGRKAFLFPGSSLYKKKPDWIVCAEIVETSRVYGRTAASIDPLWCEEMAGDLCKRSYSEPAFDPETGTVKAQEKVMLFGLPIVESRTVAYGRINPKIANEIFIQDGLLSGLLQTHHPFYQRNKDLVDRVVQFEKKMRSSVVSGSDDAVTAFYRARIPKVTSIHDLNAMIREKGSDSFLYMKESDLIGADADAGGMAALFPDSVAIGSNDFTIRYEFDPMSLHDGATVEVASSELACMNDTVFDWIVPGFIGPRIQYLLESLPKAIKKQLEPVPETSLSIAGVMSYCGEDFLESMCEAACELYGVRLDPLQLAIDNIPHHLSIKVAVKKSREGNTATKQQSNRETEKDEKNHVGVSNEAEWHRKTGKIERKNLRTWDFGDLHDKIEVIRPSKGFSIYGFPALVTHADSVDLVVFTSSDDSAMHHGQGVKALAKIAVEKEIAWLENDLKFGKHLATQCVPFAAPAAFKNSLMALIENHCFENQDFDIRKKSEFERIVAKVKKEFSLASPKLTMVLEKLLNDIYEFQSMIKKRITNYNIASYRETAISLKNEMQRYVTNLLDNKLNYNIVMQYSRYFSAFKYRIDRAFSDMQKYLLKYENIRPYIENTDMVLSKLHGLSLEKQALIIDYAMMVEEFKISTFSQQEIKTLFPVSQKKVDEKWEEVRKAVL